MFVALERSSWCHRATAAQLWLLLASWFFYGWWEWRYLFLLLPSIAINFVLGSWLANRPHGAARIWVLGFGVALNLAAIGYFKYLDFLILSLNAGIGTALPLQSIILPLAISFFTFQQIAFLADCYQGRVRELSPLRYALFVSFFPQLIAGPIVHHAEMMPQLAQRLREVRDAAADLALGLTFFAIGLFKKAVIADGIAPHADNVFAGAAAGEALDGLTAWGGALAYTVQLYFDFSGYSDMAIGLGLMFGVRLPVNFNSPYKATSIIEFWRRWHMTLSRFLKDYLYLPLGGGRAGTVRRYVNLMIVMLLGGLWHGAGWTFAFWGGLHGVFLVVNHLWRTRFGITENFACRLGGWALTFIAVVVAWVFFRAESFTAAGAMLTGMVGLEGWALPAAFAYRLPVLAEFAVSLGIVFTPGGGGAFVQIWSWVVVGLGLAWLAPNSLEIMRYTDPDGRHYGPFSRGWKQYPAYAIAAGVVLALGILSLPNVSSFLYFQF